jgi:uncharacterized membrane protein YfcA
MTTPLFIYAEQMPPVEAIASSLLVVAAASSFALIRHGMRGHIQWRTGLIFGFSGMISAFVGGQVGSHLPGDILLFAFSAIMAVTGIAMIRRRKNAPIATTHKPSIYRLILDGALVGFITGIVGAGGGFLIIPALVVLVGLPMKIAVGTSLFIIAVKSLIGFVGDLQQHGTVDWQLLMTIAAIAIAGLFLGMKLSHRVSEKSLKKGFGYFVLIMGTLILIDQFRRL